MPKEWVPRVGFLKNPRSASRSREAGRLRRAFFAPKVGPHLNAAVECFLLRSIFCPILWPRAGVRGRDGLRDGRGGLNSGDSRDATWRAGRAAVTILQKLVTNLQKLVTHLQKLVTNLRKLVTNLQKLVTNLHKLVTNLQKLVINLQKLVTKPVRHVRRPKRARLATLGAPKTPPSPPPSLNASTSRLRQKILRSKKILHDGI